jgi:hypothetical protein
MDRKWKPLRWIDGSAFDQPSIADLTRWNSRDISIPMGGPFVGCRYWSFDDPRYCSVRDRHIRFGGRL